MNDVKIAPITGAFGLACVALTFGQFPLWTIGSPRLCMTVLDWLVICSPSGTSPSPAS